MQVRFLIYAIFFASGMSGLIYQVVWLRILSRTTGVTIHATAIVVAAFMAGLALGSFIFGRIIDKRNDALKVYALLELLIAGTVLIVPYLFAASVPLSSAVYGMTGESVTLTALFTGLVSFLILLVPTVLMGGTLPILTSYLVKQDHFFGKHLSLLYGINTWGAVMGVVLCGFFLIGLFGESAAVMVGVAINIGAAASAYLVYLKFGQPLVLEPQEAATTKPVTISPYSPEIRRAVLFVFAFSGFTALAYEVIWTRQLILFLENSIYAFSAMLAVFLAGISLGSIAVHKSADRMETPLFIFGILEFAIAGISLINLHLFQPLDSLFITDRMGWILPFAATVILVFPMTFAFGMIFPIAGRCYAEAVEQTGSWVGRLYAFNTVGGILGSLAAGFLLIPVLGAGKTVVLLALLNGALGILLVLLEPRKVPALACAGLSGLVILALMLFTVAGEDSFTAIIKKRINEGRLSHGYKMKIKTPPKIFFHEEGLEGTVTAFQVNNWKQLWINGIGMTKLCTETKLMAHLPLLFAEKPKSFLVICFGMGTTVRSAALYPQLDITAVELVSETFRTFKYFHPDSEDLLKKNNIHLVANDGRNHILLSPKTYDVITVDPAPPVWSARTVNLYTREFFELCKSRLNKNGAMCLWFPGSKHEADEIALQRTFSTVFPYCSVWGGPAGWGFYLIGTLRPVTPEQLDEHIASLYHNPSLVADLQEYDQSCATPEQLKGLLKVTDHEMDVMRDDTYIPVITDNFPFTEFFLWRQNSAE
ncbi:fused MFS/spermidine synthase [Desulfomonile tiedjei]|uniref:Putative spermidine synthase with an N-terminal membrane domain n=1 Tax=Desulfomonile tiedjei (strain ATCC 49306 / DSM 6799 / DCB-1) TaxID=706587 RepID=I4CEU4_DESTA|nr:fused MFS/spermidine synthase [Desulfomonile tiedjei]AFM28085.1 putative spermidine synthase with an N-terminal membrane domain [Desulfomonile tiedjei DSM 6799]